MEELFPQLQYAQQECSRLKDEAAHQQHLRSDLQQQVKDLQAQQSSLRASLQASQETAAAAQAELMARDSHLQQEGGAKEHLQVSKLARLLLVQMRFRWVDLLDCTLA